MSNKHNSLMLSLAAYMVAVGDHARADNNDKSANERFVLATQAFADDHREFCRYFEIAKSLRVVKDTNVSG